MSQIFALMKKNLYQRKNMPISSIICELFFPTVILFALIIIKFIVKDEIIYIDESNENGIINYGPICLICNTYNKGYTYEKLVQLWNIKEIFNPIRTCQISNDSLIGIIGNFSALDDIKYYLKLVLAQEFEYVEGENKKKFSFKTKDFASNEEFENYLKNTNYKKENDPSQMEYGICAGIEGMLLNNVYQFTFRFSDDYMIKDFFNMPKIVLNLQFKDSEGSLN